jgi:hypothetical protein
MDKTEPLATVTYECGECHVCVTVDETQKGFPDPPEGWDLTQDQEMVELGCKDYWLCPQCSRK